MKNFIVVLTAAAALMLGYVTPSHADIAAIAGSSAEAVSLSGSKSVATQGNAQNITFNQPAEVATRASGTTTVKMAPAITAPNMTTTLTETCMGSSTVGGAGVGFGVSLGTTWTDVDCVRRLNAREIASFGDKEAAKELLCINPDVAAAYAAAGRPCRIAAAPSTQPAKREQVLP